MREWENERILFCLSQFCRRVRILDNIFTIIITFVWGFFLSIDLQMSKTDALRKCNEGAEWVSHRLIASLPFGSRSVKWLRRSVPSFRPMMIIMIIIINRVYLIIYPRLVLRDELDEKLIVVLCVCLYHLPLAYPLLLLLTIFSPALTRFTDDSCFHSCHRRWIRSAQSFTRTMCDARQINSKHNV